MAKTKSSNSVISYGELKDAIEKAYTIEEIVKTKYGDIHVKWMPYRLEKQIFEKFSRILDNFKVSAEENKKLSIDELLKHIKVSYNQALEQSFPEIVSIVIKNTGIKEADLNFIEDNFSLSEMIDLVMKQIEINGLGKKISDFFFPSLRTIAIEAGILMKTLNSFQK